jgi:hypothetical protein
MSKRTAFQYPFPQAQHATSANVERLQAIVPIFLGNFQNDSLAKAILKRSGSGTGCKGSGSCDGALGIAGNARATGTLPGPPGLLEPDRIAGADIGRLNVDQIEDRRGKRVAHTREESPFLRRHFALNQGVLRGSVLLLLLPGAKPLF